MYNNKNFYGIDNNGKNILKREHKYYAQVQGHLALGEWQWCDFVIQTLKDIHVQRIVSICTAFMPRSITSCQSLDPNK